jgi:hypothetical protein
MFSFAMNVLRDHVGLEVPGDHPADPRRGEAQSRGRGDMAGGTASGAARVVNSVVAGAGLG